MDLCTDAYSMVESSNFVVSLDGDRVKIGFSAATRETSVSLAELLTALRSITNSVVEAAVQRETRAARTISCKAGCGACCRQLVPITATEARRIPELLSELGAEHRQRVMLRFEAARQRLQEAGMWDRLESMVDLTSEERKALSLEYFALGIACPFLEAESCSIHAERPLMCRQYLVTSPASNCQNPTPESIARVALAASVHDAVRRLERREMGRNRTELLSTSVFRQPEEDPLIRTVGEWMRDLLVEARRHHEAASSIPPPA
jgi:Fe-S-cluster containining protein